MFGLRMVTFDVTGTLLQFRNPIFEMYAEIGRKYGINADPMVLRKSFKEEYARMAREHPIFGRSTNLGWPKWWSIVITGTFKKYAKSERDVANITKTADNLLNFYETTEAWVVQPGAHQLLQFLKRSYFKVGIISNFDTRLHAILKAHDMQQYFDFVLTSYEVGLEKPDVRIFEEALRRGRSVVSSEAIHVGDDVRLDYEAARSAGWNAMLVVPDREGLGKSLNKEDVFADLYEVKGYFQSVL